MVPSDVLHAPADAVIASPRMRHVCLGAALVSILAATAAAQPSTTGALDPPRSPRNANYTITARLDPASRAITGSEVIAWRNITARPATELQLHLYWNAWKNTRSTYMREGALAGAGDLDRRPD